MNLYYQLESKATRTGIFPINWRVRPNVLKHTLSIWVDFVPPSGKETCPCRPIFPVFQLAQSSLLSFDVNSKEACTLTLCYARLALLLFIYFFYLDTAIITLIKSRTHLSIYITTVFYYFYNNTNNQNPQIFYSDIIIIVVSTIALQIFFICNNSSSSSYIYDTNNNNFK